MWVSTGSSCRFLAFVMGRGYFKKSRLHDNDAIFDRTRRGENENKGPDDRLAPCWKRPTPPIEIPADRLTLESAGLNNVKIRDGCK